ncbi:MAG: FixH family protein [Hyphomicrobiaceae bacterium]|nr:FixH family protein [Hyphomicrobiaceae bacterium]
MASIRVDGNRNTRGGSESGGGITGRHVLLGLIAFFGVVFAVNGVFLYQALSTHTGVVANEPYRKGLEYNQRIEADARQQALGWTVDLTVPDHVGEVRAMMVDANKRPVTGLRLVGRVGRPSTGDLDRALEFKEASAGTYIAPVTVLEEGTWIVELQASELKSDGEAVVWRMRKRIWQKP